MSDDVKKYLPNADTMRRVADQGATDESARRALENPRLVTAIARRETWRDSAPSLAATAGATATKPAGEAQSVASGVPVAARPIDPAAVRDRTRKRWRVGILAALAVLLPTTLAYVVGRSRERALAVSPDGARAAPGPAPARPVIAPAAASAAPPAPPAPPRSTREVAAEPARSATAPRASGPPAALSAAPHASVRSVRPGGSTAPSATPPPAPAPASPPPPFGDKPDF